MKRIMDSKDVRSHITYVCFDCGNKYGKPIGGAVTMHQAQCDVCEKDKPVTHVRDFGWPDFTEVKK